MTFFSSFVSDSLSQFWLDNRDSPVSLAMIWDAAKATLRGHLISYTSHLKRARDCKRKILEKEVTRLEQIHKQSPTVSNLKALVNARTKLSMDHTCHIQKLLLFTKQKYYEFGNKSSCLLAHQLKNQNNNRSINMIQNASGVILNDPLTINSTFKDFYISLYSSESKAKDSGIAAYLKNISLPSCTEEDRSSLNALFTVEEVWTAIQSMPNGKCPGLDGFPLDFFKKIHPILKPAINDIWKGEIPPSFN